MTKRAILLPALAATPGDLARLLRPVAEPAARQRPAPAAWSIADVVAHLAMVETQMRATLARVVAEENPPISAIHPDEQAHDLTRPLTDLLAAFAAERAATLAFLNALDPRAWGRPANHTTLGPVRLRDLVQLLVTHDNAHLTQLLDIREALDSGQ